MSRGFVRSCWGRAVTLLLVVLMAPGCQSVTAVRSQSPDLAAEAMPAPPAPAIVSPASPRPEKHGHVPIAVAGNVAKEKDKTSLPTYVIEPPDVLGIEVIKLVPKPPYRIEAQDILQIVVVGTLLDQPIAGQFAIDASGMVDLGPAYGKVRVSGLTLDEAIDAVKEFLGKTLRRPEVSITLAQASSKQPITGEHLVGPDGSVNLGTYGTVYVAGMTINQAKAALEEHLSQFLERPKVAVDVYAYNSKVYYVISQGAGLGDQVARLPITGNETVLDAIAQINGLSRLSSKRIWIARPAPDGMGCDQRLDVNWEEITKGAATRTNYQVLPGDRIFIAEDKLLKLDSVITRITAPMERLFGVSLLGAQDIQTLNRFPKGLPGGSSGNPTK